MVSQSGGVRWVLPFILALWWEHLHRKKAVCRGHIKLHSTAIETHKRPNAFVVKNEKPCLESWGHVSTFDASLIRTKNEMLASQHSKNVKMCLWLDWFPPGSTVVHKFLRTAGLPYRNTLSGKCAICYHELPELNDIRIYDNAYTLMYTRPQSPTWLLRPFEYTP